MGLWPNRLFSALGFFVLILCCSFCTVNSTAISNLKVLDKEKDSLKNCKDSIESTLKLISVEITTVDALPTTSTNSPEKLPSTTKSITTGTEQSIESSKMNLKRTPGSYTTEKPSGPLSLPLLNPLRLEGESAKFGPLESLVRRSFHPRHFSESKSSRILKPSRLKHHRSETFDSKKVNILEKCTISDLDNCKTWIKCSEDIQENITITLREINKDPLNEDNSEALDKETELNDILYKTYGSITEGDCDWTELMTETRSTLASIEAAQDFIDREIEDTERTRNITISLSTIAGVLFVVIVGILAFSCVKKTKRRKNEAANKPTDGAAEAPNHTREAPPERLPPGTYMSFHERFGTKTSSLSPHELKTASNSHSESGYRSSAETVNKHVKRPSYYSDSVKRLRAESPYYAFGGGPKRAESFHGPSNSHVPSAPPPPPKDFY